MKISKHKILSREECSIEVRKFSEVLKVGGSNTWTTKMSEWSNCSTAIDCDVIGAEKLVGRLKNKSENFQETLWLRFHLNKVLCLTVKSSPALALLQI